MSLTDRYINQVKKRIPKGRREEAELEIRERIDKMMDERGGYSEKAELEVIKELGRPSLLAYEYSKEQNFLIGPELYGTYVNILRIVIIVAIAGSTIGITVDAIFNGSSILSYIGRIVATAINVAVGAFGWLTFVFAVIERNAKSKVLAEIKEEWDPSDLPEEKKVESFSNIGVTIEICFIVLVMVLVNGYLDILKVYYGVDGSMRSIALLDMEVFRRFVPYINGILVLQLLLAGSKLAFRKWTYPVASANLVINVLSFVLVFFIFADSSILNPDLVYEVQGVLSGAAGFGESPIDVFFKSIKAMFAIILLFDSGQGFYNAYRNSKMEKKGVA